MSFQAGVVLVEGLNSTLKTWKRLAAYELKGPKKYTVLRPAKMIVVKLKLKYKLFKSKT